MRRQLACRPGINDIRCRSIAKSPYDFVFAEPVPPEQVPVGTAQTRPAVMSSGGVEAGGMGPGLTKKKLPLTVKPAPLAKPTQDKLTPEQVNKAKLAKASDVFHEEGTAKTEAYLRDNNLDYTVDWMLSNDSGLVLIDNASGKAVVAYRGTDLNTPADWATGYAMLKNEEDQDRVFKDGKTQMEEVIQEYGAPSELIGFSRGGTLAMTLGNEFGVNTTSFNPFVNKNLATTLLSDANHTIIRTTTDPVSIGANLPNPNFKTIQIAPKADSLNPMTNHALKQFLDNDSPRRQPPIEKLAEFAQSAGKAQSELLTLKEMGQAINEGKSFSEFLSDFSPADIRGGSLSTRIYEGSNFTSFWQDAGGSFNQVEQAHLANTPKGTSTETGTTAQHRAEFAAMTPEQQQAKIDELGETVNKAVQSLDQYQSGERQVAELYDTTKLSPSISESASTAFTEQLSGASLASGFIGSYVGNKVVQTLDPNQKLKAQGDEAVSGFLAGGIGAALAGGALLPAAIAGSAGMLAGSETTRALEKAGVGKTGAQTLGGATGGATAGLAAATIGAGGAALAGAELGAAFAPETFGISIAVGAAIGGLAGLASGLWDDVFGSDKPPPQAPVPEMSEAQLDNVWSNQLLRAPNQPGGTTYTRGAQRAQAQAAQAAAPAPVPAAP